MKKSDKADHLDKGDEAQVQEEKNLNFKKMLLWIIGLGIVLTVLAYVGGIITVGGEGKGGRFGAITPEDSAAIVKGDTIKAK